MRLRRVKHAEAFLDSYPNIVVPSPKDNHGRWAELFANPKYPIHLEIGCGKGKFITEMAKEHPEVNYIGIEKYASVLLRALEKLVDQPLGNVLLIHGDAQELEAFFGNGEIERIHLNFSDPWPKNKKAKYRLTHPTFLDRYARILKNNGLIVFKTDNFGFFEYSLISFNHDDRYAINTFSLDLAKAKIENISTEFEERYTALGERIYYIEVIKRRNS